eukprot:592058-Rhodomonas_salina.1
MKIRVRSGDQAGLFRRGLEGWVKDGLQLRDYAREKDVRVNSYVPITAADLKASGTKDWESASKVVHGKRSDDKEAGGREIIPFMDLSVKQLTHTPLELTKKPSIISLYRLTLSEWQALGLQSTGKSQHKILPHADAEGAELGPERTEGPASGVAIPDKP